MNSSQALLVVIPVQGNMISVLLTEALHHLVDILHALVSLAHRLS